MEWQEDEALESLLDEIAELRNRGCACEAMTMLLDGLERYPDCVDLWFERGRISKSLSWDDIPGYEDGYRASLAYYYRAAELDPHDPEIFEEIGYHFDILGEDFAAAEAAFRHSIACGGGPYAWAGLARVLAQRGVPVERIVHMLDTSIFAHAEPVLEMRKEIVNGEWRWEPWGEAQGNESVQ